MVGTTVLCRVGVSAVANLNDPLMFSSGEFAPQINSVHYFANGTRRLNNSDTASWGSTFTTGDVIGVAYDADTGKIWFAKNNTWQASGDPAAGSDPAATLTTGVPFYFNNQIFNNTWTADFGQSGFEYTPPTGFNALNTANLPTPTIADGSKYFQTTLYTANGSALEVNQIGNSTFQPDFVWVKNRTQASGQMINDAITGPQKFLRADNANAQTTETQGLVSFDADGFSVGSNGDFNYGTDSFVGWQWLAGNGTASNTDGSITSTVSANTTAGFSIVNYLSNNTAGATVGHGLSQAPDIIITKNRDDERNWGVYHSELGATKAMFLNLTSAASTSSVYYNNTEPTASVFSLGAGSGETNYPASDNFIAFCFHEVEGFSRFGIYKGNGSTNGSFIYTGFKPAFVIFKRSDSGDNWAMYDATRDPYNVAGKYLYADTNAAETTYSTAKVDFLSNGFKWRGAVNFGNNSSGTYVYMAFAEHPFGGDGVAPATAR